VVFPEAKFKVFLTASSEERAKRRVNQLKNQGVNVSLAAVLRDIEARDERDTNRAVSPLKPADDALLLDSTDLSIEEVLNRIMSHCGFSKH
jgi:cytidylate kinase